MTSTVRKETDNSFDLSLEIADDFRHYSDRWGPSRLKKVEDKINHLKMMLVEEYDYSRESWEEGNDDR